MPRESQPRDRLPPPDGWSSTSTHSTIDHLRLGAHQCPLRPAGHESVDSSVPQACNLASATAPHPVPLPKNGERGLSIELHAVPAAVHKFPGGP